MMRTTSPLPNGPAGPTRRSPGTRPAAASPARRALRVFGALTAVAMLPVIWPARADAQYFGRNKVQYERFDFRVLRTSKFDLHYYPEMEVTARDAARMAERWYQRLSKVLDHEIESRQPLILYADHADFQQTNVIDEMLDQSTGGVTESLQRRVVMPLGAAYQDTDHVLGHELVHAFQYDIAGKHGAYGAMGSVPLWLVEGMAEYLSVGRADPQTAMWLRDAVLHDDVPALRQLSTDPRYFPYRFGQAVWAYIGGRWGDDAVGKLYKAAIQRGFEVATQEVLEMSADSLSQEWVAAVRSAYEPLLEGRTAPGAIGRSIAGVNGSVNELMVAPSVSPDGRYVAFLWARDLSIDLYLADARTGEVIRRLVKGSAETHFDALSYMGSAGTWSPDGARLATVVFAGGRQELAIVDVASGRILRRIRVPGANSIDGPAWSPDGRTIAVSGSTGGQRDLFLLDVESGEARRLTNDLYAELHPAWSLDGRTIAFTTDRGPGTDFERLSHGVLRLATVDVATGEITLFDLLPGRHTNPQFSPDGWLYFLAEADGFRDIYRTDLATGAIERVTRLATGVSGITALSPALTIARHTGDLHFSVFERRGYTLRVLDAGEVPAAVQAAGEVPGADRQSTDAGPRRRAGRARRGDGSVAVAGMLPPFDARGDVETYLADADTGLPDAAGFETVAYRARPRLSYIGVPELGVQFGGYGSGVYAGLDTYFTDILGNHGVYAQALVNGGWKEIGGQLFYENRSGRLNWGAGIAHIPYLGGYAVEEPVAVPVDGRLVSGRLITEYRERMQQDAVNAMARYPLSATRRIEVGAGAMRIGYRYELQRTIEVNGRRVDRETTSIVAPVEYTLGQASAAFVGDNSVFGIASPVDGARFRFEVAPTIGTLRFVEATADWRRYFYARPFTLAVRGLHYGRYGRDADQPQLGWVFLGAPGLVRGYAYDSYGVNECSRATTAGPTGCGALNQLFGSRIALAGLEVRVPLFGNERYGLFNVPFLPTELAAFVDAGVAWNGTDSPTFSGGDRSAIASAGLSTRFNLFGAFILETYYAVPFQRDGGGRFGIQIVPGW